MNGNQAGNNRNGPAGNAVGEPFAADRARVFFLSEIIRRPVLLKSGLRIGVLKDINVKINGGPYPEATHIIVHRPWGQPDLWLPWNLVADITEQQTTVAVDENLENFTGSGEGSVLVFEKIMDKKIIDMEDREVEVVYDIQLVHAEGRLWLTHVDAGRSGLLRRLHVGFLNKLLFGKRESPDLVPWKYVHVPADLGRLSGAVRLNVQREKLRDIHPVDLADILEELGHKERMEIFNSLDTEKAADILEELEPRVQRQLVKSVRQERIRDIFHSMTSAQIADLFSVLPADETEKFIRELDPQTARKVRNILQQREETIASLVSMTYLAFPGGMTVNEAFARFRGEARDMDVVMYIYIVGEDNLLEGVVDIRELLQSDPGQTLRDIMVKNVITTAPQDTRDFAADLFKRYYFRAIPVVDERDRILGVIRFKDLFIGRKDLRTSL